MALNIGFVFGWGDELYSWVTGMETKEELESQLGHGESMVAFLSEDNPVAEVLERLCAISNGEDESFCSQLEDFLLKVFEAGRQSADAKGRFCHCAEPRFLKQCETEMGLRSWCDNCGGLQK